MAIFRFSLGVIHGCRLLGQSEYLNHQAFGLLGVRFMYYCKYDVTWPRPLASSAPLGCEMQTKLGRQRDFRPNPLGIFRTRHPDFDRAEKPHRLGFNGEKLGGHQI